MTSSSCSSSHSCSSQAQFSGKSYPAANCTFLRLRNALISLCLYSGGDLLPIIYFGGAGIANFGSIFLKAGSLDKTEQIYENDLPELRALIAASNALHYGSVLGVGNFSKNCNDLM